MSALPALLSGGGVGFTLGLIGGGGSILATPLLLYVVGMSQPHLAIGTGALAVSANAFMTLGGHAKAGNVRWGCAAGFALVGVLGALVGSTLGKAFDGERLLFLFAVLMVVVGGLMLRPASDGGPADEHAPVSVPKVVASALAVGMLSGFFGIGGGFLIVPALMLATGMSIMSAISSSLVAVTAFGLTTALSYAWSELISWTLALVFIVGGIVGGLVGTAAARSLSVRRGALNVVFAIIIILVALYMLARNIYVT